MRVSLIFGFLLTVTALNLVASNTSFADDGEVDEDFDLVCTDFGDEIVCLNGPDFITACVETGAALVGTCDPEHQTFKRPDRKPQITSQPPQAKPEHKRRLKTAVPSRTKVKRLASRKHRRITKRRSRR